MISRYDSKIISKIWTDQNKFEQFLIVELALLRSLEVNGMIPKGTADNTKAKAVISPVRIEEIEKEVKHDIIAFCSSITENLDTKVGKFFHFGVTSSDIIDTALTLQIKESLNQILPELKSLMDNIKGRAEEMKGTLTIGRSHGMFAEPMSFGQKLLGHYQEFRRRLEDLENFMEKELTLQLSGAVGNYTILTPEIEADVAKNLGLKVEPVSTQVIPRDRVAKLISINALLASAMERLSVEIRHLHRSDVGELHEGFSKNQKGSSTMPHKKNPISAENLTGIARILKSHVSIALENIVLWHERDISHSSAERLYLPDNLGLLHYALKRLNDTVKNLVFHTEEIEAKVKNNFNYLSSYYLHFLIQKTDLKRDDLYRVVQSAAFLATEKNDPKAFTLGISDELKKLGIALSVPEMDFASTKKMYLKNVEKVFKRAIS